MGRLCKRVEAAQGVAGAGQAVDDLMCTVDGMAGALLELGSDEGDVGGVCIVVGGARGAKEKDAKEDDGGQGGDDLEASRKVGARVHQMAWWHCMVCCGDAGPATVTISFPWLGGKGKAAGATLVRPNPVLVDKLLVLHMFTACSYRAVGKLGAHCRRH